MYGETSATALAPLLAEIDRQKKEKKRVIVAIDGMCASGKTTLAETLAEQLGAGIIHMDDFFLPAEKRTEYRLHQPGGSVDYERFLQEVLPMLPLTSGFNYRTFNCNTMDFDGVRPVAAGGVVIVEGAYCMHPVFGRPYDIRVFCGISPDMQEMRIRARNGDERWPAFRDQWIPMENYYLEKFCIAKTCDFIL